MATTLHPTVATSEAESRRIFFAWSNPVVSWHLLSLDAPTVAMLWTWFIARANLVSLPKSAVLAMGLAVWLLYAGDRLLDCRNAPGKVAGLEARHFFHRQHQRGFRVGICLSSFVLAFLLPCLDMQSLRLYLILTAPLFAYFILIHAGSFAGPGIARLPKEVAVGVFFSAAVFIPTVAREPSLRLAMLPAAVLFASVCSLNCLYIYRWEHPGFDSSAHRLTRFAIRNLAELAGIAALSGGVAAIAMRRVQWPIPCGCAMSATLLFILDRNRHRLSTTTLRAAADVCLLAPILLLPLM